MQTALEKHLTSSHKAAMIAYLKSHPEDFGEAVRLAVSDKEPYSWRAAWLLWSCMEPDDKRIRKVMKQMVGMLPGISDSRQREFLMILQRMELKDDVMSPLFDTCMRLWTDPTKMPSLRCNALKVMLKMAAKYPELLQEIRAVCGNVYTDSLTAGARHSVMKLLRAAKV